MDAKEDDQFTGADESYSGGDDGALEDDDFAPPPEPDGLSGPAVETTLPVHRFRSMLAERERSLMTLYQNAASWFAALKPDPENAVYKYLRTIAACVERGAPWAVVKGANDQSFERTRNAITPEVIQKRHFDILDRIADELVFVGCGIETLRLLDSRGLGVPAQFDNLPVHVLCRRLNDFAWEHFGGSIPGYVERRSWEAPK